MSQDTFSAVRMFAVVPSDTSPLTDTSPSSGTVVIGGYIKCTGTAGNVVLIGSPKITGLADPTSNQDAATKIWTETYTRARTIPLSLDITGLNSAGIASVLDDIAPTSYYEEGTRARIHCTAQVITYPAVSLTNSTSPVTTGDFVKHYIAVDKNSGIENQPVLEDFDINSLILLSLLSFSSIHVSTLCVLLQVKQFLRITINFVPFNN